MRGFAFASQNRIREAHAEFDRAIALDGALGNAWLGRGLCRIRRGQLSEGRADLQVAATLEPNRALLRSYLAKAWTELGNSTRAERELALAKERDANDPTAWLYSALLLQQNNRINEAIGELEQSQDLNDNRRLYRSRLLLDQDRAVRGANLANIYRDAGMTDVSVREAVNAVNADYANYSAHLFLANSYHELRDPQGVNLRYETPAVSEFLVANLLAPVGAGTLSQQVSQQEYSKLFERDGFGFSSSTEYTSHGNWRQSAAQTVRSGNTEFAVEEFYDKQRGYRPNSDLERTEFDFLLKHQINARDSVFAQAVIAHSSGGNLYQYYDQADAAFAPFRFEEEQEPIIIAGFHREWNPDNHSLLLVNRLATDYSASNPLQTSFNVFKDSSGEMLGILPFETRQNGENDQVIHTVEAQHIFKSGRFTTIAGARFQDGDFDSRNEQENFRVDLIDLFPDPAIANQSVHSSFQRASLYGYEQWQITDSLSLIGGLTYERLVTPVNFRFAPLVPGTETGKALLPKAGLVWMPDSNTTLRAAYSESMGGASIDQSFQLEPTQVAGFNQAFRSLIPESVSGANSGALFTSHGISLERKFSSRTHIALTGELLESTVERNNGAFEFVDLVPTGFTTLRERLDFREQSIALHLHQLAGREWAFGAAYRLSRASLHDDFTDVSDAVGAESGFTPRTKLSGTMQTANVHGIYRNSSGLFARLDGTWTRQTNRGYPSFRPGDDFWHFDFLAGYRLKQRRAELAVGVLNLADQDYQLSPLNLHVERPRDRTLVVQFKFHF